MSRSVTFKQKLTLGFSSMALLVLLGAVVSMVIVKNLSSVVAKSSGIQQMDQIATVSSDLVGIEHAIVLHSIFDDKVKVKEYKAQLDAASQNFNQLLDRVGASIDSDEGRQTVNALRDKQAKWAAMHKQIMDLLASQQVDVAETRVADPAFVGIADEIRRLAGEMASAEGKRLSIETDLAGRKSLWSSFAMMGLIVTLGTFLLVYVRRTSERLHDLTVSLADSSQQVGDLSAEVRASSSTLAQGSSSQAASLEETAASTEELTSMTRKNAENSKSAVALMNEVDRQVKNGNDTLGIMMVSMQEINVSSDKISKIIKVIDEIAFQTNILALNAAVEAARAGEAGMGFAVVADEVRRLAQRSAQAAKDTADLIQESIMKSNEGSAKLEQVAEVIRAITKSSQQVKTLVDEVNSGSQEQARGIDQISKAVSNMDRITQGAAAGAEQSASSSQELSSQAESLNQIVSQLRALIGGGDLAAQASEAVGTRR